jgi:hypothetical protein
MLNLVEAIMKFSKRFLHLALATVALAGLVMSRALWLAPMTMLWPSTARADNPIWSPYQQAGSTSCTGSGNCIIALPAIAKETLVLQTSCQIVLSEPASSSPLYALVYAGDYANYLPIVSAGGAVYETNAQTYLFLSSGQTPRVLVSSPWPVQNFNCTVSGYTRSALPPPLADTPQPPAGLPQTPGQPMFTRVPAQ